jgi:hypothetical protein
MMRIHQPGYAKCTNTGLLLLLLGCRRVVFVSRTVDQMNYYATRTPVMPTNALWVVEDNAANAAPATSGAALARRFTSWPPPGFVPHVVVYPRW